MGCCRADIHGVPVSTTWQTTTITALTNSSYFPSCSDSKGGSIYCLAKHGGLRVGKCASACVSGIFLPHFMHARCAHHHAHTIGTLTIHFTMHTLHTHHAHRTLTLARTLHAHHARFPKTKVLYARPGKVGCWRNHQRVHPYIQWLRHLLRLLLCLPLRLLVSQHTLHTPAFVYYVYDVSVFLCLVPSLDLLAARTIF
jgi:hypothetical protein